MGRDGAPRLAAWVTTEFTFEEAPDRRLLHRRHVQAHARRRQLLGRKQAARRQQQALGHGALGQHVGVAAGVDPDEHAGRRRAAYRQADALHLAQRLGAYAVEASAWSTRCCPKAPTASTSTASAD